jgi:hypothetical protein
MEFRQFKQQVHRSFDALGLDQSHLYYTDITKDELWNAYINSFPPATRQEHNCNACRQFVKNYGNIVSITSDYEVKTFWDFAIDDPEYQQVANAMAELVLSKPIVGVFIPTQAKLGTDYNFETPTLRWEHLFYQLPARFIGRVSRDEVELKKSEYRDNKNVFKRSLEELTLASVGTVLELINDPEVNLYRGVEFKPLLESFERHLVSFGETPTELRDNYCWYWATKSNPVTRIRNMSIGTLLIDLSNDVNLDVAIRKFESLMDSTKYRRPNSPVISSRMIQDANKIISELGLTSALKRRFATLDDVPVTNMLWVNRNGSTPDVFGQLQKDLVVNPKSLKAQEVSLTQFVTNVLPVAEGIEVLVENRHTSNLVSLFTETETNSGSLFKWDNPFSWCYREGLADSLKEKVKSAGGKVEGKLRISLEWYNTDDLDLHVLESNGAHIYFGNKKSYYTYGELDVDQNVNGETRTPVENVIYPYNSTLIDGEYKVVVNNYTHRENKDVGFRVEVEYEGEIYEFTYDVSPAYKRNTDVVSFTVTKEQVKLNAQSTGKVNSKNVWGINTNKFYPVNAVMWSPNYWNNNGVGNKHLILGINEAKNNEPVRALFNEFLRADLNKHSKVFETLASKLVVPYCDDQLSGLGFSTTMKNDFVVRANSRLIKVVV